MKKYFLGFTITALLLPAFAQQTATKWKADIEPQKVFIENKSQFDNAEKFTGTPVLFASDGGFSTIYFTKKGLTYRFTKFEHRREKEFEQKTYEEQEREEHRSETVTDMVHMQWENSNPNAEVIASEPVSFYYSYSVGGKHINHVKAYRKITYKNLYPNIDAEYIFHPEAGIKYSLILHPGADVSMVKMKYSDTKRVSVDAEGNVHLFTIFGDIVDHAPVTVYETADNTVIPSRFVKNGKTISFQLGDYNHRQKVIIDPWTVTPVMPSTNVAYYIKSDTVGNAYVFGGTTPILLQKYNQSGALQWTYSTPWTGGNFSFGSLSTDSRGDCYITNGGGATVTKIDSSGAFVWSRALPTSPPTGPSIEFWASDLNCDETDLYIGGSRHVFQFALPPSFEFHGTIFKMNIANGAVSFVNVVNTGFGFTLFNINEVRSLGSSPNGNMYFLTLDTVGGVDPNLSIMHSRQSGYSFPYYMPYSAGNGSDGQGQNNICANSQFIYTTDGATIHKRDIANGSILATATIPGGAANNNSGIAVDSCGNVYAGAQARVAKFDGNLNLITAVATPEPVYDVSIGANGDVLACGHNFAVALNMSACAQIEPRCFTPFSANANSTNANCNQCNGTATANPQGGTAPFTYLWSNSATSQSITGLCAGTYHVTITDAGGNSGSASVTIIQTGSSGTVSLTADKTAMCSGDSAMICAPAGYTSYQWNNGLTSQCIYAKLAGNYYVTAVDAGNCTVTSSAMGITVYPLPPVSISVNGDTLTAYNSVTYQWYLNNVPIPGATSNVYIATQSGDYSVAVSDNNGCISYSTKVTLVTGINDLKSGEGLKVYPNPLQTGRWIVECGNDLLGGKAEVFDDAGKLVYKSVISNSKSEIAIDVSPGVYLLRINSANANITIHLVKL